MPPAGMFRLVPVAGPPVPIAVESFRALADRQRGDTFADPADPSKARLNLLNWDGQGRPPGLFPPPRGDGQPDEGQP